MKSLTSVALPRAWRRSILGLAAIPLLIATGVADAGTVTEDHAERLEHLLRHDCGSCHGMTLKGGLGPALLPALLNDRDEDGLVQMILHGNPARAMPPWRDLLSETEARWIVRRLKQGLDGKETRQ